jgi:RNA polymerase sporulation-specific sigma factor
MQIKERIQNDLGRDATIEEIAKEMEIEPVDVVLALEAIVEPISLYEPVYSDGGDTIFVMDQVGSSESDDDWLNEISIKEAITHLGEREKQILNLRFIQGKTQMEVAHEVGISQAQVSRLEKGAIKKIKES